MIIFVHMSMYAKAYCNLDTNIAADLRLTIRINTNPDLT